LYDGDKLRNHDDAAVLEAMVAGLNGCMVHFHKKTCQKNGCEGTDLSCRMQYPRPLVNVSHFNEDNCTFLLRRNHGNLVSYCPTWMKAVFGNHNFSLIPEQSRFEREKEVVRRARDEHPDAVVRAFVSWIPCAMPSFRCCCVCPTVPASVLTDRGPGVYAV